MNNLLRLVVRLPFLILFAPIELGAGLYDWAVDGAFYIDPRFSRAWRLDYVRRRY